MRWLWGHWLRMMYLLPSSNNSFDLPSCRALGPGGMDLGDWEGQERPETLSGVYFHPLKCSPIVSKNQPQSHSHRWGGGGVPARKNPHLSPQKNFLHQQNPPLALKPEKNQSNLFSTQNHLVNFEEKPLCYHLAPLHPVDRSLPNPEGS